MSVIPKLYPPILLYGPPGSGKSAAGRALSAALDLEFVDLDERIARAAAMSIPEIFEIESETGFRARESRALEDVLKGERRVIALGGGALLDPQNRRRAEASGPVVCLNAAPATLYGRIQKSDEIRPLVALKDRSALDGLLAERHGHYLSFKEMLNTDDLSTEDASWEIQVRLGWYRILGMGNGYDVRIEPGSLDRVGDYLQSSGLGGPVGVVSDNNVDRLYGSKVENSISAAGYNAGRATIPAGEEFKTPVTLEVLWAAYLELGLERRSTLAALGGGVVTDLAGFSAATYMRGINWVALPTTLLGMVDASLGGKTGIDLPQGKNLAGSFYPPRMVLADTLALETLPEAELRAGMAEVVKHAVIGDPALFAMCELGLEALRPQMPQLVRRAAGVKIRVILLDPYEQGPREALNFGHTVGHAIEAASNYQLRHGEAVAIGMVTEARLAEQAGLAEPGLSERIAQVLQGLELPVEIPPYLNEADIRRLMDADKKRVGGSLRFALPRRIGEIQTSVEIDAFTEGLLELPGRESSHP